jgi:RNA polymerase sigma-70 factor, ECF subfamily
VTGARPETPSLQSIFNDNLTYVWNALRRLGVPAADAEDVTHEVFLIVHRQLHQYEPSRPLRPWLLGICARAASDYRRLARHRREVPEAGRETPDQSTPADTQLEHRQAVLLVNQALDSLSLEQRTVLVMHDLEEIAMPTVVEALGIPLNTGYSRLRLARQAFAQAVNKLQQRGAR